MKDLEKLTVRELAAMMDHTLLKAYAVKDDFKKLCGEAAENGFAMVAINSSQVRTCKEFLKGTNIHVGRRSLFRWGRPNRM